MTDKPVPVNRKPEQSQDPDRLFEDGLKPREALSRFATDLAAGTLPRTTPETQRPGTQKPSEPTRPATPSDAAVTQEKRAGEVHPTPGKAVTPGDTQPAAPSQSGARQEVQPSVTAARPGTPSSGDLLSRALNSPAEPLPRNATSPEANQGSPVVRAKDLTGVQPVESGLPKPAEALQRQSTAGLPQTQVPVERGAAATPNTSPAPKVGESFPGVQPAKAEPVVKAPVPLSETGAVKPEPVAPKPESIHPNLTPESKHIFPPEQKPEGISPREIASSNVQPTKLNEQGLSQGIHPGAGTAFDNRRPEAPGFKSSPGEKDSLTPPGRSDSRGAKIEEPTWKSGTEKTTGVGGTRSSGPLGAGSNDLGPKELGPKDLGAKSPVGKDLGPKPQGGRFGDVPNILNLGDKGSGFKGLGARLQALELGFGRKDKAEPNAKSRPVEAPLRINGVPVRAELGASKGGKLSDGQSSRADVSKGQGGRRLEPSEFVVRSDKKNQGPSDRLDGKSLVDKGSSKVQPGDRVPPQGDRIPLGGGKAPGVMQGMVDSVKENIKSGLRSVLTSGDTRRTEIAASDKSQGARVRTGRTEGGEPAVRGIKDGDRQIFSSKTSIPPLKEQIDTRSLIPVLMPAGPAGIPVLKDFGKSPKSKEGDGGRGLDPDKSAGGKLAGGAGRPFIRLHLPDGTYGGITLGGKGKIGNFTNSDAQDAPTRRNTVIGPKTGVRVGETGGEKSGRAEVSPAAKDSKIPDKASSMPGKDSLVPEKDSNPNGDNSDSFGKPYLAVKGDVSAEPAVPHVEAFGEVEIVLDEGDTVVSKPDVEGSARFAPGGLDGRLLGAEQSKPKLTEEEALAERRRRRYMNENFESQEITWSMDDEEPTPGHHDPMRRYIYIVKPGDTVESVAAQVLEDPALAPLLYRKNKQFVLPELEYGVHPLQPGVEIELPTPSEIATFRMSGR